MNHPEKAEHALRLLGGFEFPSRDVMDIHPGHVDDEQLHHLVVLCALMGRAERLAAEVEESLLCKGTAESTLAEARSVRGIASGVTVREALANQRAQRREALADMRAQRREALGDSGAQE